MARRNLEDNPMNIGRFHGLGRATTARQYGAMVGFLAITLVSAGVVGAASADRTERNAAKLDRQLRRETRIAGRRDELENWLLYRPGTDIYLTRQAWAKEKAVAPSPETRRAVSPDVLKIAGAAWRLGRADVLAAKRAAPEVSKLIADAAWFQRYYARDRITAGVFLSRIRLALAADPKNADAYFMLATYYWGLQKTSFYTPAGSGKSGGSAPMGNEVVLFPKAASQGLSAALSRALAIKPKFPEALILQWDFDQEFVFPPPSGLGRVLLRAASDWKWHEVFLDGGTRALSKALYGVTLFSLEAYPADYRRWKARAPVVPPSRPLSGTMATHSSAPKWVRLNRPVLRISVGPNNANAVGSEGLLNVSSGRILVGKVTTSCGCTSATETPLQLGPGGKALITVHVDTSGRKLPLKRYVYVPVFLLAHGGKSGQFVKEAILTLTVAVSGRNTKR
jgi:hypothetical protein